jgi:hypothetical protein
MYDFAPMMPVYNKFLSAPPCWLLSKDGKRLVEKAIALCLSRHGEEEARRFEDAVTVLSAVDSVIKS